MNGAYLPKEETFSKLPQTVLRSIWTNKVINTAIGAKNEVEAREWFRQNPEVHAHFQMMNQELDTFINHLQKRADQGLREIRNAQQVKFEPYTINFETFKKRKI